MKSARKSGTILVVDDDPVMIAYIAAVLSQEGHSVQSVSNGDEALSRFEEIRPDLLILDVHLPGRGGLEILQAVRSLPDPFPVIMVSADHNPAVIFELIKHGAHDYFVKPVDQERLIVAVRNTLALSRREKELRELKAPTEGRDLFRDIDGEAPALVRAIDMAKRVLDNAVPVLILGETGTGKESLAKGIHFGGPRKDEPFVALNCASVPEPLLEAELFGHEKGAFTGAVTRRIGRFEQADGGTLFLDEIGDMPPGIQAKLLRVLQERVIERVGGQEPISVDVRILSATNQNLEALIREKRFREDLYYRINTVTITMPHLRERIGDIPLLARRFLEDFVRQVGKRIDGFTAGAVRRLQGYAWKGNIRELKNVIERAVLLAAGRQIDVEDLHLPGPAGGAPGIGASARASDEERGAEPSAAAGTALPAPVLPIDLGRAVEEFEKTMIRMALARSDGARNKAARYLGLTPRVLSYKIEKYSLDVPGRTVPQPI